MHSIHLTLKSWATWDDAQEVIDSVAGNPLIEFVDGDFDGEPPYGRRD